MHFQELNISIPLKLYEDVERVSKEQAKTLSAFVSDLVESGYTGFDKDIENRSGRMILADHGQKLSSYSGEHCQLRIKLDRRVGLQLKLTSKEYRTTISKIVGGFLANALWCNQVKYTSVSDLKHHFEEYWS